MTPVRIPKKAADLLMQHDRELKAATARFNDAITILAATLDGVGEGWQIRMNQQDGTMEFFDPKEKSEEAPIDRSGD